MADRPIIFSAPMVRALLDGRKTQTRRVIQTGRAQDVQYAVGDRLWVREAWRPGAWREDGRVAVDYRASPDLANTPWVYPSDFEDWWIRWTDKLIAARVTPDEDGVYRWESGESPLPWLPSIHMPRWASRLTLVVTDVRVQRLQDTAEADAIAEGARDVAEYSSIWQSLYGPDSWDQNPWVVALTFAAHRCNIDAMEVASAD